MELQPWFEAADYRQAPQYARLDETDRKLVDSYRENGFVILENTGLATATLDGAIASLKDKYTQSATGYNEGGRRQDAWRFSEHVREIATAGDTAQALRP